MLKYIKQIIILLSFSVGIFTYGQDNSMLIDSNNFPKTENSFLNPNNLTMNQSVSFMTTTGNGLTQSIGIYSNYFDYQINPKLNISTGIHLVQPSNSEMFGNSNNLNYDFRLNYKFSENFQFEMNVSNLGLRTNRYRNYIFNQ